MSTHTVTPAQARKEITRRARPKDDPKRKAFPARHVMELSNADLAVIAAADKAKANAQAKAIAEKLTQAPAPELKADAQAAYKAAHAAAQDGDRVRAGKLAYRLVLTGKLTLAQVLSFAAGDTDDVNDAR